VADGIESEGPSADGDLALLDEPGYDPEARSDDNDRLSQVWLSSDYLRLRLRTKGVPTETERTRLKGALVYQLTTVALYWQLGLLLGREGSVPAAKEVRLFILLFPGEGKDNTGIKDLNDKVIGQWWTGEFIRRRFEAVEKLFGGPRSDWMVAAQTYKTAYLLTYLGDRKEFVAKLAQLDAALCEILKKVLDEAEPEASAAQKKEIKKLRRKLGKRNYRFDLFFGTRALKPGGAGRLETVFLLVTEALKGAALARFVAKTSTLRTSQAKKTAKGLVAPDPRKLDPRGKAFDWREYMKASDLAERIKKLFVGGYTKDVPLVLNEIYVDTVWTWAFLKRKNLYWGNPDTVRDVRKRKLQSAPLREGNMTYSFPVQKELLEVWLVVLNLLDYVKRFETPEFAKELQRYHDDALEVFTQLGTASKDVDWAKLEKVLTHDVRQHRPIAVFETASEFQFYAFAADHRQRIFFSMDIRDMGVELMLHYEHSNREVGYHRHSDEDLMVETFRASDAIDARRRFTYDRAVAVFEKYYDLLARNPAAATAAAVDAFAGETIGKLGTFGESVQIMLGGDEVYAAAHPLYAHHVPAIVKELDTTPYGKKGTVDLRASVAFSSAPALEQDRQRREIQLSHQEAMKLAEEAPAGLKELERTHRRIARLIEMLEANPKKRDKAPPFRKRLDALPIKRLFARAKHRWPRRLQAKEFDALVAALRRGELRAAEETGKFDLVDYDGKIVKEKKLREDAAALEAAVRQVVGRDNTRVHLPPVTEMPKEPGWLEELLDIWS